MSFGIKHTVFGALSVFAVLVGVAADSQASDSCTNVHFQFVNGRNTTIEVLSVEYFNSSSGNWKTENVKAFDCLKGHTCTTSGDNLSDAEARNITKVKFNYKYREADGDWSKLFPGGEKTVSAPTKCSANRTYGPFTITG